MDYDWMNEKVSRVSHIRFLLCFKSVFSDKKELGELLFYFLKVFFQTEELGELPTFWN